MISIQFISILIQFHFVSFKVPRVFIDGKFIGGGDDTVKLDKNGELVRLLKEAGVLTE